MFRSRMILPVALIAALFVVSSFRPRVQEDGAPAALTDEEKRGFVRRWISTEILHQEAVRRGLEDDPRLRAHRLDEHVEAVAGEKGSHACILPDPDAINLAEDGEKRIRKPSHMAYLKIAEGCSRHCTFCVIPKSRGRQKSRLPAAMLSEAQALIGDGVKEGRRYSGVLQKPNRSIQFSRGA